MSQKVKQINIENFTTFKNLETEFSPKINVIIGTNGTGKTLLLKSIFHLIKSVSMLAEQNENSFEWQQRKIGENLIDTFDPRSDIQNLGFNESTEGSLLQVELEGGNLARTAIDQEGRILTEVDKTPNENLDIVYIPSNEFCHLLPLVKGNSSVQDIFPDLTYREICEELVGSNLVNQRLQEPISVICSKVENIIGGKFYLAPNGSMLFREMGLANKNTVRSINLCADGFHKLGILAKLLETGSIAPERNSLLLWDVPETNLSPSLMHSFVEIIYELMRDGLQIILTTHSYVILKWFELLSNSDKGDEVLFHILKRNEESSEIDILTSENYSDTINSSISEAYASLTDFDISKRTEEFSKQMEKNAPD